MMADHRRNNSQTCSSPPCFAHELSDAGQGFETIDPQQWLDVMRWRKSTRITMLAKRTVLSVEERGVLADRLGRHLVNFLLARYASLAGHMISGYWPIKSELDLRSSLEILRKHGANIALPVVVEKGKPLQFYAWQNGDKMERGFWNIPVPALKKIVHPDIFLAPLVGWDHAGYRLGYGGGYFDRTLANDPSEKFVIGVGLQSTQVPTIFPQPHDIRLNAILTEDGVQWCEE